MFLEMPDSSTLVEGDRPLEVAGRAVDDARVDTRDVGEHGELEQAAERLVLRERGFGAALLVLERAELGAQIAVLLLQRLAVGDAVEPVADRRRDRVHRAVDRRDERVRGPPDGAERAARRRVGCRA